MSDHDFWPREWVETFKLRGAFGYSGKAPGAFDKLRTWFPISGDEGSPGFTPNYTGYQNGRRGAWLPCYAYQEALALYKGGDATALDGYTALERARCATNAYSGHNSDFWLDKADFWKLRSISLTYDLPSEWVSRFASRASVSLSGRNLLTWTDFTGTDPEVMDNADRMGQVSKGAGEYGRREYYTLPPFRTFLLTLRMTF